MDIPCFLVRTHIFHPDLTQDQSNHFQKVHIEKYSRQPNLIHGTANPIEEIPYPSSSDLDLSSLLVFI